MKLQTYQAFKNHLKQNFEVSQDHLFCVIGTDFYEREIIVKEVLGMFQEAKVLRLDASIASVATVKEELDSNDLFSHQKVVVLRSIEKASKSFLKELSLFLKKTDGHSLIIEGEKLDSELYNPLKAKLTALDLCKEKPWDRKSRIISWLHFYVRRDQKELEQQLAEYLYDSCEKQLSLMIQELSKLVCYCKDSKVITLGAYKKISSSQKEETLWGISEAIVFQTDPKLYQEAVSKDMDAETFHRLIFQLRYHFQIAAKLQALKEKKEMQHGKALFPTLGLKTYQKYQNAVSYMPRAFAENGLLTVFEAERKAKSFAVSEGVLWIELLARLHQMKEKVR